MPWSDPRCGSLPPAGRLAGPARAAFLGWSLLAALSGCTIVNVSNPDGVRTTYYPGLAVIRVTPTDSVQVIEVESLGASSVANNAALGWNHSRIALVPPGRCQLVLWRADEGEVDELRSLIGPRTEICDSRGPGR